MGVQDYKLNPDENTTISGINVAEGCPPSGINNAIRQLMADIKADSEEQNTAVQSAVEDSSAASEAATAAQTTANEAKTAAEAAQTTANAAQNKSKSADTATLWNGSSKTISSAAASGTPANGAIWFQYY